LHDDARFGLGSFTSGCREQSNSPAPKKLISQAVSTRFYLSSPVAKNIPISFFPKLRSPVHVPRSIKRGVSRSSRTLNAGCGGRTSPSAILARTNGVCADGEVVWSWRSEAGAKVVKTLARLTGDGGNQAMVTEESAKETVKPTAQGRPVVRLVPVVPAPCISFARGPWVRPAPGLPCALLESRGQIVCKARARQCREAASACSRTGQER
jgi:hypothetical protein